MFEFKINNKNLLHNNFFKSEIRNILGVHSSHKEQQELDSCLCLSPFANPPCFFVFVFLVFSDSFFQSTQSFKVL